VPERSLKRSSRCGARTSGIRPANGDAELVLTTEFAEATEVAGSTEVAGGTEVAGATEVSEEELPHNSRTAGETGSARSPSWNKERKAEPPGAELFVAVEADAMVTGVT
jgi:hypothetical protein